jgi:hypothetical protein
MAEIILKIGSSTLWDDGDVVEAVNDKITSATHAEIVADPRKEGFNSDGLRPSNGLGKFYLDCVYSYRFERVSKTEVLRLELDDSGLVVTDSETLFGPDVINVEEFVLRRYRNPNHKLFGTRGKEIWYGGSVSTDDEVLDNVWNYIEFYTENLRDSDEFKYFPLGSLDKKHFLAVPMVDFADDSITEKKEPLWKINDNGLYLWTKINEDLSKSEAYYQEQPEEGWERVAEKSRVRNVDWINNLEGLVDPLDVLDSQTAVDIRLSSPKQTRDIQTTKYNNQNITPTR